MEKRAAESEMIKETRKAGETRGTDRTAIGSAGSIEAEALRATGEASESEALGEPREAAEAEALKDTREAAEPILTVDSLTKRFGDLTVLDGINLKVREGEVIVIVGPSGCGKSTFLRCLNALEDIQGGEIRLRGETISRDSRDLTKLRQKVGMVFQSYELFPHLNVLDNILLAPTKVQKRDREEVKKEAMALLARIGLESKAESFPRQLSGGQKQRVAIIRALCMHPEVMLFDEVTAALDPEMVREVLDVILELANQGRTMLIVTHEMQFARAIADRVVFINEGRIWEEGAPDRFFDAPKTERAKQFLRTFTFERKGADAGH